MKDLIVATDFSANAQTALDFAIHIANHYDAKIHLIHTYEVHTRTGMMVSVRSYIEKDAEEGLSREVKRVKSHLHRHTSLEAKAIEGHTVDTICAIARQHDADLIVMGTQGASGLKKLFFGSVAAGVIRQASNAVLAIPAQAQYTPFKAIALAVDTVGVQQSKTLAPLKLLLEAYQPQVRVVHVAQEPVNAERAPNLDAILPDQAHAYFTVVNEDILEGLDQFLSVHATDLLVMVHHSEDNFFDRIFHRSKSIEKVMETAIPLLILSNV